MRLRLLALFILLGGSFTAILCLTASSSIARQNEGDPMATGIVYHDANGNQRFDQGEKTLAGIRVSNGSQITQTDARGRYRLPIDNDTIIFVIKPRGWRTPLNKNNNPVFYYIHKPHGSPAGLRYAGVPPTGPLPKSVDFPLYPQEEPDQFRAIMFGDPQPRNQQEIDYIAHDVIEELVGTDASLGVTLGDILFDDLSLFESQARSIGLLGIPWYNVIGNHDINLKATHDRYSDETFESHFGPSYYSFDHGSVHFLVLDNIEWIVTKPGEKGSYRAGLGAKQLAFVKRDLALIPEKQLVVIMMHVPLIDTNDRQGLYRLIEKRPFCMSISGHTHHHEHRFITREDGWQGPEPHHHVINVTVSGSWWSGAPDARGIPHTMMADGAPNGYSILSFDGHKYSLDFKAASQPADYQMRIQAPEVITADQAEKTDIYVNVFNGSERSTVEMRLGKEDSWTLMERKVIGDPEFAALSAAGRANKTKAWRDLPAPKACPHLWHARLPKGIEPGTHMLQVRTVDMHGRTYHGRRILRIKAAASKP